MKLLFTRFAIPGTFLFLFGSCSVQDHLVPATSQHCKVVDIVYQSSTINLKNPDENLEIDGQKVEIGIYAHEQYEYDDQGRVTKVSYLPTPTQLKDIRTDRYEYPPNQVVHTITYPNGTESKSTVTVNEHGNTVTPTSSYQYEYNSEGFIVKSTFPYSWNKQSFGDGVAEYSIENGNIVKYTTFQPQSGLKSTTLYEYDLSRPNLPSIYWFNSKESTNLLTKITLYYGSSPSEGYKVFEYRYTFDSNGQVNRKIEVGYDYAADGAKSRTSVQVIDYTVNCQK
ncbi:hypothetical protein [Larkinella sp.]|uniref:hypothetical protein n=1 Tax=Larkinella sp. TaxID=2034517 RepID=UPI003BAAA08E